MDIIELVAEALEPLGIDTLYGWYDKNLNDTHITYLEFDNSNDNFADDEATTEEHYITVDLWTKNSSEVTTLKKEIKRLLKLGGFFYQDGVDQTEAQTDGSVLYHITTRWLYEENL
ncbi:hypothetical protein [Clostridium intestinale]|uniref:hypothetical protein n=1 Tax=Clostridium intestinale TaxID=36845 RepID=UPI0028ECA726|nr:hypothetical protein [Clostridium intestinale]